MLAPVFIAESAPDTSSATILSPAALVFLAALARAFRGRISNLRAAGAVEPSQTSRRRNSPRAKARERAEPSSLGSGARVELVGPADTASLVSAASSGASAFVADLDDAMLPRWRDLVEGQALLRRAIARAGRSDLPPDARMPPIILRPRSFLANEEHVFVDAEPVPAGLVDVGLYCFHNARQLVERGGGPWVSLTKIRGVAEARLWADVAMWLEQRLTLPPTAIKLAMRVDSVAVLSELDLVVGLLRSRLLSLGCGRYELLSDFIAASSRAASKDVTPPRSFVTIDRAPLSWAATEIVKLCRHRGIPSIGPELTITGASRRAFAEAYASALRQVRLGFDGVRVVDPELVLVARAAQTTTEGPREVGAPRSLTELSPSFAPTESAVRENIDVALAQLGGALSGQPRVRVDSCLEGFASARAARAQLWQWLQLRIAVSAGELLDRPRWLTLVAEESARIGAPPQARALLEHICLADSIESLEQRETQLARDLLIARRFA